MDGATAGVVVEFVAVAVADEVLLLVTLTLTVLFMDVPDGLDELE
ncbi:MAG: hypothetical protein Q8P73_03685 [bacterium]|nr:hypothetical protein [bacterium]